MAKATIRPGATENAELTAPAGREIVAMPEVAKVPEPTPKRRIWPLVLGGLGAVAIGLLLYFQPWTSGAPIVATEIAAEGPVTRVLAVNGRIEPVDSVYVRPLVSAKLTEVLVREGDMVRANQIVAQLDEATQSAVVRQALANLDAALVIQQQADATVARSQALGANIAAATLQADEASALVAAQDVARMRALFDQAQVQLAAYTIHSPLAGQVLSLSAVQGQNADPTNILMTIADVSELVVETSVDEAYATQVATGQSAVLQLAGESQTHDGHVNFVSGRVDPATGGLSIKIAFDAVVSAPVGLTVTANIVVDQRDMALTVPRSALNGSSIFVLVDGVAKQREVEVIDWPAARLIVTSGLAAGDVVITDASGLADGQAVKP